MTDGIQTVVDEGTDAYDILYAAVQPLKHKKVRVITLGIGFKADLKELQALASTREDMYMVENFEILKELATELAERKCPGREFFV